MVPKPHIVPVDARDEAVVPAPATSQVALDTSRPEWQARLELEREQARTERLRVLADFLARPIHAHGGAEPDPDIVIAYNLAVEAALQGIRRAAISG